MKKVAGKFMKLWSKGKFAEMYELTQKTWQNEHTVEDLEDLLGPFRVKKFCVGKCWGIASNTMDCKITLMPSNIGGFVSKARVIREVAPIQPSEGGTWGVNPISVLKNKEPIVGGKEVRSILGFFSRS